MRRLVFFALCFAAGSVLALPEPALPERAGVAECTAGSAPCACPAGQLRRLPPSLPDSPGAALAVLERAGFSGPQGVRVVRHTGGAAWAGRVMGSNPAPGASVCGPVTVRLVVGAAPRLMPELQTMALPEALNKLQKELPGLPAPALIACGRPVERLSQACAAEFVVHLQWPPQDTALPAGPVQVSLRLSRRLPMTRALPVTLPATLAEARAGLLPSQCQPGQQWAVKEQPLNPLGPAVSVGATPAGQGLAGQLLDAAACTATLVVTQNAEAPPAPPPPGPPPPAPVPAAPLLLGALGGAALARLGGRSAVLAAAAGSGPDDKPPQMRVVLDDPW